MSEHVPATSWSEHTQVEAAPVTQVCTHGHSICQQTDRWKGWTPGLSEEVVDVGGGDGDALHSQSRVTQGPLKVKKKNKKSPFSRKVGRAQLSRRWRKHSSSPPTHYLNMLEVWWKSNLFNLTMISWTADSPPPSLVTDIGLQAGSWNLCV